MASPKTATRTPLTRERVLQAAVRVMDADGLEALTMRRLGRELGVEAMSLYNHIDDKQDLWHGMIETIFEEFVLPEDHLEAWEDQVRALARSYRTVLLAHPNVMQLVTEQKQPITNPDALRPVEAALAALREAGLSDKQTGEAYLTFAGYIMGHVMQETRGMFAKDTGVVDAVFLAASLPADRLPCMVLLMPQLCQTDLSESFDFGVDVMIAGLRALAQP